MLFNFKFYLSKYYIFLTVIFLSSCGYFSKYERLYGNESMNHLLEEIEVKEIPGDYGVFFFNDLVKKLQTDKGRSKFYLNVSFSVSQATVSIEKINLLNRIRIYLNTNYQLINKNDEKVIYSFATVNSSVYTSSAIKYLDENIYKSTIEHNIENSNSEASLLLYAFLKDYNDNKKK